MNRHRLQLVILIPVLMLVFLTVSIAGANSLSQMGQGDQLLANVSEETGMIASYTATTSDCVYDSGYELFLCPEPEPGQLPQADPAKHAEALRIAAGNGLLLIPESTNDRVMAFDTFSGDLLDPDFIPADPTNLSTPIHAILSAGGNSFLVSDQINDSVEEYDLSGAHIGQFAGSNTAILDNVRGISLRPNGNLLVTVGGGANTNSVAEFDTVGVYQGNFVAAGSGGLNSPFDVYNRITDWLVGGISSDAIHRYDATGAYIADLTAINTFPEQLGQAANGNVLVANFSGTEEGVVEYTAAGALVGIYDPAAIGGYRGVHELGNGNILTTNGSGVHEIDRLGNLVSTKISGVSARFIESTNPFGGPAIIIEKSPDTQTILVNGTADFTIAVTNTGTVTLTNVFVSDALTADCDNNLGDLVAGASTSYTCSNVGVTASFTNTAVVSSTYMNEPGPRDIDDAFVEVVDATLAIEKSPDYQLVTSGETANFTITVTNTGSIQINAVTVSDALVSSCDNVIGSLPPGNSVTYYCSDVGVTDSYTNTAVVTGVVDFPVPQIIASDDAVVEVDGPTNVSLTDFNSPAAVLSPLWLAAIVGLIIIGFGVLVRRRFQNESG